MIGRCDCCPWACRPVPSCLHWCDTPTLRRAGCRVGAALGGGAGGGPGRAAWGSSEAPGRGGTQGEAGVHRPAAGHPDLPASPAAARSVGGVVQGGPLHCLGGGAGDTAPARGARLRRPRPARHPDPHPGGPVRLRGGRGHRAAHRRHRDPGTPAPGSPVRPEGVRLGQEEAEHDQDHQLQRRPGPHPVLGVVRPGRMHDQTAVRTEGIAEQFRLRPQVKAKVDDGYRGLAGEFPDQISAPPSPARMPATANTGPGGRPSDGSPRRGSVSSTPTPS